MWIRTQTGRLINAERIRVFDIGEDNKSVVAIVGPHTQFCAGMYDNTKDARDTLEKISAALKLGKKFLALD